MTPTLSGILGPPVCGVNMSLGIAMRVSETHVNCPVLPRSGCIQDAQASSSSAVSRVEKMQMRPGRLLEALRRSTPRPGGSYDITGAYQLPISLRELGFSSKEGTSQQFRGLGQTGLIWR
jgi:hypothetical protein